MIRPLHRSLYVAPDWHARPCRMHVSPGRRDAETARDPDCEPTVDEHGDGVVGRDRHDTAEPELVEHRPRVIRKHHGAGW